MTADRPPEQAPQADGDDEVILIGEEHLDRRVELEQGMSAVPRLALALIALDAVVHALVSGRARLESVEDWVAVGAKHTRSIVEGDVWRLVSPALLHGGWDHLLGNAMALYVLGVACEHAFGRTRTLALFVATAVAGSLLSMADPRPGVGASGAVFGLMGALATAIVRHRASLHVRDKRVGIVLFAWAAWSLVTGAIDPVIDNLAHLGGFVAGCALGAVTRVVIVPAERPPSSTAAHASAAAAAAALAWALVEVLRRLS